MGKFTIYNIPLKSLSEGVHTYEYQLDKKYFTDINDGDSDIKKGNVAVDLSIKRISSTFELNFNLNGEVVVACDRCLDDLPIEIASQNRLFVKFGKEYSEESDEIVIIPEDDGEINIAWFLFEFIALNIPIKKVHAPGKCNKMMTSKLNKHSSTSSDDLDEGEADIAADDVDSENDTVTSDPRWESLKGLELDD
ncbi:MAG: YceD family protein [Dysgonomonas sp.]